MPGKGGSEVLGQFAAGRVGKTGIDARLLFSFSRNIIRLTLGTRQSMRGDLHEGICKKSNSGNRLMLAADEAAVAARRFSCIAPPIDYGRFKGGIVWGWFCGNYCPERQAIH